MTKEQSRTVPVSSGALIQRLNRKLAQQDEKLKTSRGTRAELELGRYYILEIPHNYIAQKDVDLEELGREFEVLADYEHLAE